jgi:outer membrane receptor protein involved in Fe transport
MRHNNNTFRLRLIATLVASAFGAPHAVSAAESAGNNDEQGNPAQIKLQQIDVISTTPLPGIGLPLEQVPANVQTVQDEDLEKQNSLSVADYMQQNLVGVNVNDTQNNPYQPDIQFRGFTASPLLGTPQGLSVFVDGVRVNEPFGDVVNWDLIPVNAINSINLVPGSNPLFGLNTLGGALSIQTKSGFTNPGGAVEAYTGSWGRKAGSAEYGGVIGENVDYFISANTFDEDGWRDASPSQVHQIFGKIGWQNETTALNLSYTGADTDLIGNGLVPQDFMNTLGRDSIFTKPDQTENKLSFLVLNGSHFFNDDTMFSGNMYYRNARTSTLNGDGNDDYDEDAEDDMGNPIFDPAGCVAGNDEDILEVSCRGAENTTRSRRIGYGFTGQFTFNQEMFERKNQFIVGAGYDYGRTNFRQTTEFADLTPDRGVAGIGEFIELDEQVQLRGVSKTWSVFATDTMSLTDQWHLTLSARYNRTRVDNDDKFDGQFDEDGDPIYDDPANQSLSGNHSFNRVNPAIGLNFTPTDSLTFYGSYNEGSRAPTAIELGCANPLSPCKLPNAFAGDPPLDQVVAKTYEAGARGRFDNGIRWSATAYRSVNHDDILFVASNTTGEGYFDNFGRTRRQGIETALSGEIDRLHWSLGYSFVDATFQSSENIVSENNSSADADGQIQINSGDRIPGIPRHQFKLRADYAVTSKWNVGTNIIAFSEQYARGNENNAHRGGGGKVSGYAVVNLDTRYNLGHGWQLFAKLNNIFDREYNNAGLLGETLFNSDGTFNGEERFQPFYAPGAPRAGWFGVRWEFGGARAKTSAVDID